MSVEKSYFKIPSSESFDEGNSGRGGVKMPEPSREQIDKNYSAFQEKLPELLKTHLGKFALMRDGEILAFFDTASDAYVAATKLLKEDESFSVQEVVGGPINLGYFSYAVS